MDFKKKKKIQAKLVSDPRKWMIFDFSDSKIHVFEDQNSKKFVLCFTGFSFSVTDFIERLYHNWTLATRLSFILYHRF